MSTTKLLGELEVDHERGVIYFHGMEGITVLRICSLGKIPHDFGFMDITWGKGWSVTPNER